MVRLWLLGLVCLLPGCTVNDAARSPPILPPPNILLLVAEDLGTRVGAFGDGLAKTPNLDALARQSMRFTQVFTTAGVCAPSRAALIMGQHQNSFGAGGMRTTTGPLGPYLALPPAGLKAFPELLRRAGYYTFTDQKLDYQFSGIRAGSGPFSLWSAEGANTSWRGRSGQQPFFGLLNFIQTHESGVMRPTGVPFNATHKQTQAFRAAAGLNATAVTDPATVQLPPYYPDLPEVREDIARHYDNIHAMDAQVGRVLEQLEADGLDQQTIVIWTTDHGDGLPRAKRELFDSGLRVPLMMRVPERYRAAYRQQYPAIDWAEGASHAGLVSFVDLAPTLLALAQVAAPSLQHGQNFLAHKRRAVFAARDRIDEVVDRQRAIRTPRYKYILSWHPEVPGGHALTYRDGLAMVRAMRTQWELGALSADSARWFEPTGPEQLYDLEQDPHELRNLAGDPMLESVRTDLHAQLLEWLRQVGDTGAQPEQQLRESLLTDGQIPVTPTPLASLKDGVLRASGQDQASIGYRTESSRWQLYTGPVAMDAASVEVKAVRYGWRESAVVRLAAGSRVVPP